MDYNIYEIDKREDDKKTYKMVEFSSGFKLLNIINPDTDISVANMIIKVGSMHESIYVKPGTEIGKGVVHFLEHMLFIESETYNIEKYGIDYFQSFIEKHGGSTNASTHSDFTQYYFEIQKDNLLKALDIFFHFFIDPTFNIKYVEKEKMAVHNEYSKNIESEIWKIHDILQLLTEINHPYENFATGNIETLLYGNDTKQVIYKMLIQVFNDFYIQKNMTLVIYHNIDLIENYFDKIANKIRQIKINSRFRNEIEKGIFVKKYQEVTSQIKKHPFKTNKRTPIINLKTSKTDQQLILIFQFPKYSEELLFIKPLEYVDYILNSYNENGINNILLTQNLAYDVNLVELDSFGKTSLMLLSITMTMNGFQKQDQIIQLILYVLKQNIITLEMYENIKNLLKIAQKNAMDIPVNDTLNAGAKLLLYSPQILNISDYTLNGYDSKYVNTAQKYLSNFNFSNCIIFSVSNQHDTQNMKITKWHNASYELKYLENIPDLKINFALPQFNKYALSSHQIINILDTTIPKKIQTLEPNKHIWIRQDNKYKINKCCIGLYFAFVRPHLNINELLSLKISNLVINEIIKNNFDELLRIGYDITINNTFNGITIIINGSNEQMNYAFNLICKIILNLDKIQFNKFYEIAFEQLKVNLQNQKYNYPIKLLYLILQNTILPYYYTHQEQLTKLNKEDISSDNCYTCFNRLIRTSTLYCLIQGNISDLQVNKILIEINNLKIQNMTYEDNRKQINFTETNIIYKNAYNDNETNCALGIYYPIINLDVNNSNYLRNKLILIIDNKIRGNSFFKELRTEQQFGYYVKNEYKYVGDKDNKLVILSFEIQSSNYELYDVYYAIQQFLKKYQKEYNKECKNIEKYKKLICKELDVKFNNYLDEFTFNLNQILNKTYNFNEKQDLKNQINEITSDDLKLYYQNFIKKNKFIKIIGIGKNKI